MKTKRVKKSDIKKQNRGSDEDENCDTSSPNKTLEDAFAIDLNSTGRGKSNNLVLISVLSHVSCLSILGTSRIFIFYLSQDHF